MRGFWRQIYSTIIVNLGVLSLGILLSYTSPSLPSLEKDKHFPNLTSNQKAWIASIAHIGSLVACFFTGQIMRNFGRKLAMMTFALLLAISWVILGMAQNIWIILLGRFLTGIFCGSFKIIAPIFIGEISDKEHRGFLSGFYEVFINLGILVSYISGLYLNWSNLAFLSTIFPIILIFAIIPVPDSAVYYNENGEKSKAIKSLAWFKGKSQTDLEILKEIKSMENPTQDENTKLTYREIFSKAEYSKPLLITIFLNILEQLTGYSAFIFYTVEIFLLAGNSDKNSEIYGIIVGSVQLVGTILSSILSDRLGRKSLLITSLLCMSVPLTLLGVYFVLPREGNPLPDWIPLLSMLIFIFFMSIGIAPVSSTIPGEILPVKIREFGASLSIGVSRIMGFLVTFGFEIIQDAIGIYTGFWIFAGFCIVGVLIVYLFIPETKGKSLQEIQELFRNPNTQ